MNELSVPLLCCGLFAILCFGSSGGQLSDKIIIRAYYDNVANAESRTFRTTNCSWMASSPVKVEVEDQLWSFAEFVKSSLPMPDAETEGLDEDALQAAANKLDDELVGIRSGLLNLLFFKRKRARIHPPIPAQVEKLCERCQLVVQNIWTSHLLSDDDTRTALKGYADRFMMLTIDCWKVGTRSDFVRTTICGLHQGHITDLVTRIRLVELAARAGTTVDRLSPTFHHGLVVCRNFDFLTDRQRDSFNSSLLCKRLSLDEDAEFERLAAEDEIEFYAFLDELRIHYNSGRRIQVYHRKPTAPNGPTRWELVSDMEARVMIGRVHGYYLSLFQTKFELHFLKPRLKESKTVEYHPIKAGKNPLPLGATFTPQAMDLVVIYCLGHCYSIQWHSVCKWMRKRYSLCLPDTLGQAILSSRGLKIPSSRIAEFTLASLITVALGPANDVRRQRTIKMLGLFFDIQFPLLRGDLAATLKEYIDGERPFPEHLSGYSGRLLRSEVLQQLRLLLLE